MYTFINALFNDCTQHFFVKINNNEDNEVSEQGKSKFDV